MNDKKEYITVKDYQKFQHYKDGSRPTIWIKLYFSILNSVRFVQLTELERWVFIGLLLLASQKNNKILYEKNFLKSKIFHHDTDMETLEDTISSLISNDLIAIKMLSSRYQCAILEKSRVEKSIYIDVFNFWNEQKPLISHRKLTDKMKTKIRSTLKDYELEELQTSIKNYAEVLNNPKYFWTHRWILEDFLARGVTKFLETPLSAFEKNNNSEVKTTAEVKKERKLYEVEVPEGWVEPSSEQRQKNVARLREIKTGTVKKINTD